MQHMWAAVIIMPHKWARRRQIFKDMLFYVETLEVPRLSHPPVILRLVAQGRDSASVTVTRLIWWGQVAGHTILLLHHLSHHPGCKAECFQIKLISLCFKEDSDGIQIHCTLWHRELSSFSWHSTCEGQEQNLAKSNSKCLFFPLSFLSVFLCSLYLCLLQNICEHFNTSGKLMGI